MNTNAGSSKILSVQSLKNYIGEWFDDYKSSIAPGSYDTDELVFQIVDLKTLEKIFFQKLNSFNSFSDDMMVSTEGIVNPEFRGIIEKCIDLDEQLKKVKQTQITTQKGE